MMTSEELQQARHFGLNDSEYARLAKSLGRPPTRDEVAVCGALWSEHCSYKSSRVHLRRLHTSEPWVLQGPGENAGIVAINDAWGIAFKMESHNHPSYIEPYQGAATGVGGILRDVFCMGARPIANLNSLRFGEMASPSAWNSHCLREVVRGIGDYGNSVGVPTVGGDTAFHPGYEKNILVNAFTAGIIHKDRIYRGVVKDGSRTSPLGNLLVYFGSATGRDGVHGATMSSAEFSAGTNALRPTVQVGDPFAEKVLLEATLALLQSGLVVGLQDMGAAGIVSSGAEMAARSGCGVTLDLDLVPQRAADMRSWEILLSESQERMLCAVRPENLEEVLALLKGFDLSAAVIGRVTDSGAFECRHRGTTCVSLPVSILVEDAPRYEWPLEPRDAYLARHGTILSKSAPADMVSHARIAEGMSLAELLRDAPDFAERLAAHPHFCSRFPIYAHYCATVQGRTVSAPGALRNGAAAVVRLPDEAQSEPGGMEGAAFASGCEERWVHIDPLVGTAYSALKIARKLVAVGATPLGMTDCLNFGSPSSPPVMRQLSDAIDGINLVAREFRIPVVSGNVSLNNQTDCEPIPPTPMLAMTGKVNDVRKVPAAAIPEPHVCDEAPPGTVWLAQIALPDWRSRSSYQASQVAWLLSGGNEGPLPELDLEGEKRLWKAILAINAELTPTLMAPAGQGGLLRRLVTMAFESSRTLAWNPDVMAKPAWELLAEGNAGFVCGVAERGALGRIEAFCQRTGLAFRELATLEPTPSPHTQSWRSALDVWHLCSREPS